ncbi:hypothetical protein HAHE_02050 [Haloferula helveola]|uniref:Transcriptional regulator LacI/GalR-like sensor domain-containing protein n=1 Tax=Haloferula helveola TaxID=490095 RepID=A0ABN6GZP7_9BACT|nr:hypothetical protein HAHE_02050 [Haloferula helveola]
MAAKRFLTISEQLAEHLRRELARGRWNGLMPGKHRIAKELGLNNKTVESAFIQLEKEGLLVSQGAGRRRLIQLPDYFGSKRILRFAILFHDAEDRGQSYLVKLQDELVRYGHAVVSPSQHLVDLGMKAERVARVVERTEADAWIVISASSDVLEWFLAEKRKVFALFGRRRELPIPGVGPNKPDAYAAATRELIRLGHRRIVLLCPPERRHPEPGASERAFLAELASQGIPVGSFHLPEWDGSVESFYQRLESLFHFNRPTALILDEVRLFAAARSFLAAYGVRVPEDISLVCTDYDAWFNWCRPTVAHLRWDTGPVIRRIVRWASNVSRGKPDLRQVETPVEFVSGGTIGPPGG